MVNERYPKSGVAHSAITLESTNTESAVISMSDYNCLTIEASYALGAAEADNTLNISLLANTDGGSTYRTWSVLSPSSGTVSVYNASYDLAGAAAGTTYTCIFTIKDISVKGLKIAVKETGVAANKGTVTVNYRQSCS